jgi:hypothetical protein
MSSGGHTIPPSQRRATVSEDDGSLRIAFPPPERWVARVALPLWFGILAFGLVVMVRDLPSGLANTGPADIVALLVFLLLFLSIWLTVGGLGLYRLLFNAVGRELVAIDTTRLTFRREVPLFTRARTYQLPDVRNLRATRALAPLWVSRWAANSRYAADLFGLTGGVIAFDYGGRTIRVGGGIDEAEAKYLVARILQHFPSLGAADE